jgi:cytoskeletal protein CcmA (bactofilin family)
MWNKREEEPIRPAAGSAAPQATAVPPPERREVAGIGPSITIVGDVSGDEDLTILGRVEGKIELPQHTVTIGQGGRVKADIRAKLVSVAGEVQGNLVAGEQIVIRRTATMLGNLTAPRVGLEDGCRFRGSVEMETPPAKGRPAPVPGPAVAPAVGAAPAGQGTAAPPPRPEPIPRP